MSESLAFRLAVMGASVPRNIHDVEPKYFVRLAQTALRIAGEPTNRASIEKFFRDPKRVADLYAGEPEADERVVRWLREIGKTYPAEYILRAAESELKKIP